MFKAPDWRTVSHAVVKMRLRRIEATLLKHVANRNIYRLYTAPMGIARICA